MNKLLKIAISFDHKVIPSGVVFETKNCGIPDRQVWSLATHWDTTKLTKIS